MELVLARVGAGLEVEACPLDGVTPGSGARRRAPRAALSAQAQTSAWFAGAEGGDTTLTRAGGGTYTLEGCDTEKDGYGAIGQVFNSSGKEVARARDVGGADNGCAITRRIPAKKLGRDIQLRITVKDHDGSEGPAGRAKDEKPPFIRLF